MSTDPVQEILVECSPFITLFVEFIGMDHVECSPLIKLFVGFIGMDHFVHVNIYIFKASH